MSEHLDKFMASAEAGARQRVISGCAKGNDLQKNAALYEIKRLQADNKALQHDIARHLDTITEVVAERGSLKERVAELESTRKDWCINFHFWWMGVGGTNTYQGYADWLKLGRPIVAGPPTTPEK